ncbi:MAG: YitT family protein [Bacteroidota bacterium]|nr:YitT family protein [Bacteroidota bacterium]
MRAIIHKLSTFITVPANSKSAKHASKYKQAKHYRQFRLLTRITIKEVIFILLGICSAAFGLESFLLPNQFIDGGVTGISLLASELTKVPLYILVLIINIPFILLGYKVIGKQFSFKTAIAITCLAICIAAIKFPEITHDKLLVSVFGGFFLGAGIGFSVRGGAVLDGTEVLAIFLSRKLRTTVGDIIILINIIIFSVAAYLLSVETALYSVITYLTASKTLDFIIEGIDEYTGVTIISHKNEMIRQMIIEKMGRGVTVYKGKQGFGKKGLTGELDIVYTVITRLELSKLNTEIEKIDENAFVVMSSVKDTRGGMIKKRPLH